jgi:N-acetylglucosaminyldiphosphoundecaprenol N-acetyl-beta-D-mannosaminyltransferase
LFQGANSRKSERTSNTAELNDFVGSTIEGHLKARVLNVNAHALNLASRDDRFRSVLNSAELVFCDGRGVIIAGRVLGFRIPEKITYADWLWDLSAYCTERRYSMYFLGGAGDTAWGAAKRLRDRYFGLDIRGCHHGFFQKQGDKNESVVSEINKACPDILVVGFGMPLQEFWIEENHHRLNCRVFLAGGACFDYVSGRSRRCPGWMSDYGMEWLFRFCLEPRRLFRRYLLGNPAFAWRVLAELIRLKLGREHGEPHRLLRDT